MKSILQLLFFSFLIQLISLPIYSQGDFAPIGAKWYFSDHVDPFSTHIFSTSLRDTNILEQASRFIQTEYFDHNKNLISKDSLFVYEKNDSVYYYNKDFNEFLLLYDFTAKTGDTLGFISPPLDNQIGQRDSFYLSVDTVETIYFDDVPLKFFRVDPIEDSDPNSTIWSFEYNDGFYIEGIGSFHTIFLPKPDIRVAIPFPVLTCYQNEKGEQFLFLPDKNCATDISNPVREVDSFSKNIHISPNPSHDYIRIELVQNKSKITSISYELISINGAIKSWGETQSNQWNIDLSSFPTGVYILKVKDKNQRYGVKKIIKL